MTRTANRIATVLFAFIALTMIVSANPASAAKAKAPTGAANVKIAWSKSGGEIKAGDSFTVTAKFGRKCRSRVVKFETNNGNGWITMNSTKTTSAYPSVAFSGAGYMPGTIAYRVRVGRSGACKAQVAAAKFVVVDETVPAASTEVPAEVPAP